jgi:hypothetical protein
VTTTAQHYPTRPEDLDKESPLGRAFSSAANYASTLSAARQKIAELGALERQARSTIATSREDEDMTKVARAMATLLVVERRLAEEAEIEARFDGPATEAWASFWTRWRSYESMRDEVERTGDQVSPALRDRLHSLIGFATRSDEVRRLLHESNSPAHTERDQAELRRHASALERAIERDRQREISSATGRFR